MTQKTYPKEYPTRYQEIYHEKQRDRKEKDTKVSKIVKFRQDPTNKNIGKPTHRGTRNKGNKTKQINILTINVRGITSKIYSPETTLHTQRAHITKITERIINKFTNLKTSRMKPLLKQTKQQEK